MTTLPYNVHLSYILEIICNKLQISSTQYNSAEGKYTAVGEWLRAPESPLRDLKPTIFSQGSFRMGTTVKPISDGEYDVDLVCHLQKNDITMHPMVLLDTVFQRIKANGIYGPISEKKNRCVCINYNGDFHLDILPAITDPSGNLNNLLVPDRNTQSWKASNPKGYAEWFENAAMVGIELLEKARIEPLPRYEKLSDKLPLQQTVQLLKRWRDVVFIADKEDAAPPSIVLTTLAGNNYTKELLVVEALTKVVDGISKQIDATSTPLVVYNPSNYKEILSEKWHEKTVRYSNFVKLFQELREQWGRVLAAKSIPDITAQLERLFGEKVVKASIKEYSQVFSNMRESGRLGIDKQTGILSNIGATSTVVRKNTFYGEDSGIF